MSLPETPRARPLVLLEPMGKVRLGMKAQRGRDRLDGDLRFAKAPPGVRDATAVEITAGRALKLSAKKPGEMRDCDASLMRDALPIQRHFERP